MEVGVGVDGGVGEDEQDGSIEVDVGTGEVEGEEEWLLKEWSGGGKAMGVQCL